MMRETHEPFGVAWWLGTTLAATYVAHEAGWAQPFHPVSVVIGAPLAAAFAAGRNSPDIDHAWAPGPPRRGYHWAGHRGITHRVWFASLLTALCVAGIGWLHLQVPDVPVGLLTWLLGPLGGWWSHLAGDMIYGRIKILGRARGLGWETGGLSESGGRWLRDPAAKVATGGVAALGGLWLAWLVSTA